jgi:hypothetical protein
MLSDAVQTSARPAGTVTVLDCWKENNKQQTQGNNIITIFFGMFNELHLYYNLIIHYTTIRYYILIQKKMSWFWGKKPEENEESQLDDEDDDGHNDNEYSSSEEDGSSVESLSSNEHEQENIKVSDDVNNANNDSRMKTSSSAHSLMTDDEDNISMIDDVDSLDDDFLDSSSSSSSEEKEKDSDITPTNSPTRQEISNTTNNNNQIGHEDDETGGETDDDEEGVPTSFWEKQSLLVLAAEHDRVDILKAILTDKDEDQKVLMNSGIPPLHLAITFGSVNATVALLRMGADPSIRPDVDEFLQQQKDQPDDSKVDIPHIKRFHDTSAWELAFGNELYDESIMAKKSNSWFFGSSSSSSSITMDGTSSSKRRRNKGKSDTAISTRVIKPVDMPPSKREGVRHAFTAEALRSVGADEVHRLEQLMNSGMPATIDIGGKDLYAWAVEMGALKCEELLRPTEAAKYDDADHADDDNQLTEEEESDIMSNTQNGDDRKTKQSTFVVHRPTEETVPQLNNRLDELESLAAALSTCLDNLAEEVSVCHGLLLMGGGATALASHVKSLKALKYEKLTQLEESRIECQHIESELLDLVHSAGDVGREVADMAAFQVFSKPAKSTSSDPQCVGGDASVAEDKEREHKNLMAQIAASENKVRCCVE